MSEVPTGAPPGEPDVAQLLEELGALPPGSPERERVRGAVVEAHLGLVHQLARRFAGTIGHEDAVQVGSIGLIKAVDGFDPGLGHAFASYATAMVIGELRRHLRDATWIVRAPRRAQELQGAVQQARDDLDQRLGRTPTLSEIAAEVGVDVNLVVEVLETFHSRDTHSLDAPAADGSTRAELRVEETGYRAAEDRMDLSQALVHLDDQEREAVRLRFVEELSQREIAEQLGVSQMQVSRLLRRSVDRLRRRMDV